MYNFNKTIKCLEQELLNSSNKFHPSRYALQKSLIDRKKNRIKYSTLIYKQ